VVATDRYAADDASTRSWSNTSRSAGHRSVQGDGADAPVLREDLAGKTTGATVRASTTTHFRVAVGDKDLTDAAFRKAEVTIKEMISYHRTHPSPLENLPVRLLLRQIRAS